MLGFFLRWSINLLALVIAGSMIPGIRIQSLQMGIIAAGILGIVLSSLSFVGRSATLARIHAPPPLRLVHHSAVHQISAPRHR